MAYDPGERKTPELLADWAAIMRELRDRDVIRTNNNPVGDIAEAIVAAHYGGKRGSFAQPGWDVETDSERIQVKAMRRTPTNHRTNLSPIRDEDYDVVVVVVFDEDFHVLEGLRFPKKVVDDLPHNGHVNGRIVKVTETLRQHPLVEQVDLAETAQRLHAPAP